MKNKIFGLFVVVLVALFSNCVKVSAIEYKSDLIPNNSYVIGNHIFTSEIVLTTKHIMLGATTIDSGNLSDMIIYYKTPWGEWWDGLSGETINVSDKFNINYVDTKVIMSGDVDQSGVLDIGDVSWILKYISGSEIPETVNISLGDVNSDGEVDDVDVAIIRKKLAGYDISFPYDSGEKYTIKYNLDGGVYSEDVNILTYASISLPFKLNEPTKEGYVFLGWTGSNGDTPQKNVTILEETSGNLEYTANWVMLGDVDQNKNLTIGDIVYILRYINGKAIPEKLNISHGDVNLDGEVDDVDVAILVKYSHDDFKYDSESNGIRLPYDSGEKYTIKYNLDGGTNSDDNIDVYAAISLPFELREPTKEGQVFLGWTGSNGDTPQKNVTILEETTGNLEYTANWGLLEQ